MTYDNFISQFEIYPTQKSAQKKGFEAHHIIPRAMQDTPDDRCVRLTPFQHIYAHYLLALESKEAAQIFFGMYNFNCHKLTSLEQITLENLRDWAEVRETGIQLISDSFSGEKNPMYGHHHTEETKRRLSDFRKGSTGLKGELHPMYGRTGEKSPRFGISHTEESRKKMSESHKGKPTWNKGKTNCYSEETKKKMSEGHKGKPTWNKGMVGCCSEETKRKISESNKGRPAWNKGLTGPQGNHWWNNGIECKLARECPGPDWVMGRLKKERAA